MAAEILPGILSHTVEEYSNKLEILENANCQMIQIDIMDGQFVPNISVMPHEIMSISTTMKMEIHIMTFAPERYYSDLTVMGAERILIHREAYDSFEKLTEAIAHANDYFSAVGVAYNPETEIEDITSTGAKSLQIMGVHPGASGQSQMDGTVDRVKQAADMNPGLIIAVDGGVFEENITQLKDAGARRFVISSHLFLASNITSQLQHFIGLVSGGV